MKRVMVIDDQACVRDMVKDILEDWEYPLEVEEAENGMEAWVNLECRDYDLLICDVKMPEMTGFEVLQKIRSLEHLKEMPIVMLTAEADPGSVLNGIQLGATSYVTKPFNLDDLMDALKMHI